MQELNQRVHDLVRFMRHELHNEGLITDEEFAQLAGDHGAVYRLEDYDAAIAKYHQLWLSDPRRPSGLVNTLIREIAYLNDELQGWKSSFHMYRNAWLREIGGKLIQKGHDIDAFVLTTRWVLGKCKPLPMDPLLPLTSDDVHEVTDMYVRMHPDGGLSRDFRGMAVALNGRVKAALALALGPVETNDAPNGTPSPASFPKHIP